MTKNMGNADRLIRTILAVAFIVTAFVLGGLYWILGALGVVFLATASVSSCPLYMPFGISTRKRDG
jgi:hypothetical protein